MKELMENTNHKKLDFHFTDIWSNFSYQYFKAYFQIPNRY